MILVVLVAVGQRLGYARAYIGNTTIQNLGAPRFADARKKAGGGARHEANVEEDIRLGQHEGEDQFNMAFA